MLKRHKLLFVYKVNWQTYGSVDKFFGELYENDQDCPVIIFGKINYYTC